MLAAELVVHILSVRLACQPTSQQYYSLILNQHQPPANSQSAILFSHNKSAPATAKRTQRYIKGFEKTKQIAGMLGASHHIHSQLWLIN